METVHGDQNIFHFMVPNLVFSLSFTQIEINHGEFVVCHACLSHIVASDLFVITNIYVLKIFPLPVLPWFYDPYGINKR